MGQFILHEKTFIYMALYLKKSAENRPTTTITQFQLASYAQLVIKRLSELYLLDNNFSFQILPNSEPEYKFSYESEEVQKKIAETEFTHNIAQNTYSTDAELAMLSFKSIKVIPRNIKDCFLPQGFEDCLGIEQDEPTV